MQAAGKRPRAIEFGDVADIIAENGIANPNDFWVLARQYKARGDKRLVEYGGKQR